MANSMMEELEIKEPTPSLAPSQYESPLYTKKWRIVLAILLGVTLMGLCILGFYVSVKTRGVLDGEIAMPATSTVPPLSSSAGWRSSPSGPSCLSLHNDTCPEDFSTPPLLVIGLDGLRPDALREDLTPALVYLRKCGATTHGMVPTYPTTTFPNMYTIATGLYPESHGVVANKMHDPDITREFVLGNGSIHNPAWWGGEPIWYTSTKQGMKSATLFWPGSDVSIQGGYAAYWKSYQSHITFEERITKIHEWLRLPGHEMPHLIMVYFEEPMRTIRQYGLDSEEADKEMRNIDLMIDELMNSLHKENLAHCINVMVLSDHGVAPFSCSNNFHMQTFMKDIEAEVHIYTGAVGRLRTKETSNKAEAEEKILNTLRCKNPKVRALPKELLPRRYHYTNNKRIENIILDTSLNTRLVTNSDRDCKKAIHGYNNLEASMQALFIGFGPDFKVNQTSHNFRNVELYNLMCQLLHIKPVSNNGTAGSLNHLLRDPPPASPNPAVLTEELLPPPVGMLQLRSSEDACQCFIPEAQDALGEESLARRRRSGEASSSGSSDTNKINNTENADSSDSVKKQP